MTFKIAATSVVLSLLMLSAAGAADPIGSAVRVVNQVSAEADQAKRTLATGDGVSQNEVIAVEPDSLGELRLNDETKLAIGPGSKLKLDKFVYDPNKGTGTVAVDVTIGAFRFITGVAKKNSYTIRTPSASISVRGTIFDVYVEANGTIWVLLHEGSIQVCNAANQCRVVNNPCSIVRVSASGELTEAAPWNRQPRVTEINFETAFPFVVRPPQVDPSPRFTRVNVETGTCLADPIPPEPRVREAYTPAPTAPQYVPPQYTPPPQQTYVPPSPTTVQSANRGWSGAYVGISFGANYQPGDTYVGCDDPFAVFDQANNTPNCQFPIASGALETRYQLNDTGVIGGVQIGYNQQVGNIVYGIETDFSASTVDGKDFEFKDVPPTSPGYRFVTQGQDWFGTLRLRAGMIAGNVLFYGTGGLAYAQVDYSYKAVYPVGGAFADFEDTKVEFGWTIGTGAEINFGNFSLKAEYLYYDLGDAEFRAPFFSPVVAAQPAVFEPEYENQGHIGRIGINFPLGAP